MEVLFIFLTCFVLCSSIENDLTLEVPAGSEECLYQPIKQGINVEVEYQVIDGGDIDIDFSITSPSARIIVSELRKQDAVHKFTSTEAGDYKFCLDNSFSRFSQKVVFFEIVTDEPDEDDDIEKQWEKLSSADELVEVKLEDFKRIMDKVKKNLDRSETIQNAFKILESRDRSIMEHNFERVNTFSAIQLGIMITVGLVQVLMIRSLFDEKSKLSKLFKAKT